MSTVIESDVPIQGRSKKHVSQLKKPMQTTSNAFQRRHDLDALRAIAMLLGIVLHAALSFSPIPWTVNDSRQSDFYSVMFAAIHGFRMPLFFMVSGFFTAMLWRRRDLGGLIKQRVKRILLPLLLGCVTIVPAMWAVSYLARMPSPSGSPNASVWEAVVAGDVQRVHDAIHTSEIATDAVSQDGATLLTVSVFLGHTEMVKMLLDEGADIKQRNGDQGTALHSAAFIGRAEEAALLLQAGADPDAKDANGQTPKDLLKIDFGTSNYIASSFGVPLEEETLKAGRAGIAKQLGVDEYLGSGNSDASGLSADAIKALLFQMPVFMHLWFLYFLCWLVAAFVLYAALANSIGGAIKGLKIPKWIVCTPLSLLWLVPLTMLPQSFMSPGIFGPDSSIGLLPIPSVLAYYAVFFFFGAIYWDMDDSGNRLGRHWEICLVVAAVVIFPLGLDLVTGAFGIVTAFADPTTHSTVSGGAQALFTWLMIFGSIGACHRLLSNESKWMRYISDSSYWLYLAHLPLVLLAQWLVKDYAVPSFFKFVGITVLVSVFLLVTYEYGVRYTFIGRMLNGPRSRKEPSTA
ncbi:acyltransferase family protein [Stieleria sp. JC731]|uniref:acyltransferase family protein n=1 Tax=Pirellulaceae TaxID=2691357 RepID=UPI001E62B2E1|nr:acyltransferase family protein [Stieleria sp. JC731]MCC9602341.1 acyltransferase family protein [Stieleria sp. JC731]